MLHRLKRTDTAIESHSALVRSWECDRNGHWNVQFYVRAFQFASELCAAASTGESPGAASSGFRHYRFHAELFAASAVKVLSARVDHGPHAGAVLHRLVSTGDGKLSATGLECPDYPVDKLPACTPEELAHALPRGLSGAPHKAAAAGAAVPVGIVRTADTDHHGLLQWVGLMALSGAASHDFLNRIGVTADWIDRSNQNRMAVEMSTTLHAHARAGDMLEVACSISDLATRSFTTRFDIRRVQDGAPLATTEQLLLVVDLEKRKPVTLPDFIRAAAEGLAP